MMFVTLLLQRCPGEGGKANEMSLCLLVVVYIVSVGPSFLIVWLHSLVCHRVSDERTSDAGNVLSYRRAGQVGAGHT